MRIQIASDLHVEFGDASFFDAGADVIVLAGDIGVGVRGPQWVAQLLERTQAKILVLPGNHEFYGLDIDATRATMRSFCAAPTGWTGDAGQQRLFFLDNDQAIIDGVRFLGSTLWTDFMLFGHDRRPDCMRDAARGLNDFRLIKKLGHTFTPADSLDLREEAVRWLDMKLTLEPFDGPTVVITHHCPSWNSVAERYREDTLSACFASKLDHLMGFSQLWIHGHTHESFDYKLAGTRVICNPRGYPNRGGGYENREFRQDLVVDISR